MSFSYNVKEELCSCITDRDKKYACLYGMLLFCKHFDFTKITLQTEHDKVIELFRELVRDVLHDSEAVTVTEKQKKTTP